VHLIYYSLSQNKWTHFKCKYIHHP
jgi:hypothetical protein